jgi:hypothetical protein
VGLETDSPSYPQKSGITLLSKCVRCHDTRSQLSFFTAKCGHKLLVYILAN